AGVAPGALLGSYWYMVNAVETGHLLGDQSAQQAVTAPFRPAVNLVTAYGMAVDSLDLSGAQGRDILLYAIAAVVLAGGLLAGSGSLRRAWRSAALGAALVASPFLLLVLSRCVGRPSLVHLYDALGKPEGYLPPSGVAAASPTTASDTASWFGPLGFLFVVGAGVAAVRWLKRRSLAPLVGVFALAPFAWFVLVAVSLSYNQWLGRFFIFAVGLSAAGWGRALRSVWVAWGAVASAAVTVALNIV